MTNIEQTPPPIQRRTGCGLLIATFICSALVVFASSADLVLTWIIEQSLFDSSGMFPDFRIINQAICAGIILVVCLIMSFAVKHQHIRLVFRLWLVAAILAVLAIPVNTLFLTAQNETVLFQLGAMIILFSGSMLFKRRDVFESEKTQKRNLNISGLIVFLGALICLPWVLWGSLGSVLDTILELIFGGLFAWTAIRFIFPNYLEKVQIDEGSGKISRLFFNGFVVAVFLLICVAALSINGSGQMLVLTVPVSGWLIAYMSFINKEKSDHGRWNAGLILGLLTSLPLMFFDMDELSAVFAGGEGEILSWATKSSWFTFLGLIMITVLLFSSLKGMNLFKVSQKANIGFTIFGIIGVAMAYLIWGQVGFFGDNQFVILKEQSDLTDVQKISDLDERRQAVYETLITTAESTQISIRQRLDKMHVAYTPYYLLNAIEIEGNIITRLMLSNDPAVDRILESPVLRPLPEPIQTSTGDLESLSEGKMLWNIKMIHADQVIQELGIDGSGIVIGQTDSGVDGRHQELAASYRGAETQDDYNWYDPWNNTPFPTDHGGHGTATLSVVLGEDTGVAPGAQWMGCVNLDRNLGNPAVYLNCMQFMLAPFPQSGDAFEDGDPAQGAMIINNSWGCPDVEGCDPQVYEPVVKALKMAGIFMSVSAGNSGNYGCSTVTTPAAIYADVFTVGSVNSTGDLSSFSSIGPVLVDGSNRHKPDLVAPGENVVTAFPGDTYIIISGTSFSAPHVTGVVALMWSANPDLIGNIEATSDILKSSTQAYEGRGPSCGRASEAVGSGILDAYKAVQAALDYQK